MWPNSIGCRSGPIRDFLHSRIDSEEHSLGLNTRPVGRTLDIQDHFLRGSEWVLHPAQVKCRPLLTRSVVLLLDLVLSVHQFDFWPIYLLYEGVSQLYWSDEREVRSLNLGFLPPGRNTRFY